MFRNTIVAAAVVGSSIFCLASWATAQQAPPRPRSQMSLAERLEQFRRSLTGEPTTNSRPRTAAQRPPTRQSRAAQSTPQGRTAATQPRAQRNRQPTGNSRQNPEILPGLGLGGLLGELTGTVEMQNEYTTSPRAGSRIQPGGAAAQGVRERSAPAGRLPLATQPPYRSNVAPRQNLRIDNAPVATRPEQASPPAVFSPRERQQERQPTTRDYHSLEQRLSAARRELSSEPREPSPDDETPTRLSPTSDPQFSELQPQEPTEETPLVPSYADSPLSAEPFEPAADFGADDENLLFTRQSPTLKVVTAGPRKVVVGKPATYRVMVENSGELAARSVIVTVRVPEWAQVVGTKPTGGTANPPVAGVAEDVLWKLDRVEPRGRESLELEIIPRKSRPFDLAVGWSQSPLMAQTTVDVQEPKLRLVIAGADEALFGESEVYKLTLSNPGNGDAENVIIRLLPIGQSNEAPVTHAIGTIRAGGRKVIEIELTPRQSGTLAIKAEAGADGGLFASVAQEVLVRRAGIEVAVNGPSVQYAGTTGTYEVQVTNTGNASADNVQISAALPARADYVSSNGGGEYNSANGDVRWTIDRLLPGSVEVFTVKCALKAPGTNSLQVAAAAAGGLEHSAVTMTQVEALADLKLEVVDPRGPLPVGQETTYSVTVRNRGTKSAENVEVLAFFSTGVEPLSVEGGRHVISQGQVEFAPISVVPAGGEVTFRIKARADMSGNHVFRAEVHCKTLGTSLVAEETTRFYSAGQSTQNNRSMTPEPADQLQPVPADY